MMHAADFTPRGLAFVAIAQGIDALKAAATALIDQDDDRAADLVAQASRMAHAAQRQLDPNSMTN